MFAQDILVSFLAYDQLKIQYNKIVLPTVLGHITAIARFGL